MALKTSISDREYAKFREYPNTNDHAVAVYLENLDPIEVTGSSGASAPTGPFEITVLTVTDVAANPIAVPLTQRVNITLRNKDISNTVYFGKNSLVTADDTSTGGWEIGPGEDFSADLDDNNNFYLITTAGDTAVVKIMEIASSNASTGGGGGGGTGPGGSNLTAIQEQLIGLVDGSNTVFNTTQIPDSAGSFILFVSTQYQIPTAYTRITNQVTLPVAPQSGETVYAQYWY